MPLFRKRPTGEAGPDEALTFLSVPQATDVRILVRQAFAEFGIEVTVLAGHVIDDAGRQFGLWNVALIVAVQILALSSMGLYAEHERFREPLGRLLLPALFLQLLTLATVYFLAPAYSLPRSVLVGYLAADGLLLAHDNILHRTAKGDRPLMLLLARARAGR